MDGQPSGMSTTPTTSPGNNTRTNHCQRLLFNCDGESSADPEYLRSNEESDRTENILAEGMNQLSFVELQREQEDLHGVAADHTERTGELTRRLFALESQLQASKSQTAYETAERMNPDYVSDRDFRLNFLRANRYDPEQSADQMIRYFEIKSQLFGVNKLTKDIRLSDLSSDDIHCLRQGNYQISPIKDRANRTIIIQFPSNQNPKMTQNELRSRFFFYMDVVKSLNSTNRSIVHINYGVGRSRGGNYRASMNLFFGLSMVPYFCVCCCTSIDTRVGI